MMTKSREARTVFPQGYLSSLYFWKFFKETQELIPLPLKEIIKKPPLDFLMVEWLDPDSFNQPPTSAVSVRNLKVTKADQYFLPAKDCFVKPQMPIGSDDFSANKVSVVYKISYKNQGKLEDGFVADLETALEFYVIEMGERLEIQILDEKSFKLTLGQKIKEKFRIFLRRLFFPGVYHRNDQLLEKPNRGWKSKIRRGWRRMVKFFSRRLTPTIEETLLVSKYCRPAMTVLFQKIRENGQFRGTAVEFLGRDNKLVVLKTEEETK